MTLNGILNRKDEMVCDEETVKTVLEKTRAPFIVVIEMNDEKMRVSKLKKI